MVEQKKKCILELKRNTKEISQIFFFFLAALGLRCCVRAFSSCGEWGLLFDEVHRLLIAVALLIAEHGLYAHGLQ